MTNNSYKGTSLTKFHRCWSNMLSRCYNPNVPNYKNYGARGIRVTEEWLEYKNFYNDMFSLYKEGLQLDRIDNDGNYSKENCRWATFKEQANNRSDNRYLAHNDKIMTAEQWAEVLGIKANTIIHRLRRGWSIQKTLEEPVL